MRILTGCALLALTAATTLAPAPLAGARWELQYNYEVQDSDFIIMDLAFPSATRGVAVGYLKKKGRIKPISVVTSDGGNTWTPVRIKEPGLSLFFLNDSLGWMVTEKGLWQTLETGRGWKKISKKKKMIRVWFRDEQNGWAVGREKNVWTTADGGVTWTPLPAAAEPPTTKDYTTYNWITFANPRHGAITGFSAPPRRRAGRFPDWMDPERASRQREWPTSTIVMQTLDGGRSWKSSVVSMFGRIVRLRLQPTGDGLALVRFQHAFEWPAEVYRINLSENQTVRTYRKKNRAITDIMLTDDGGAYMAGVIPPGSLANSPIPGRLVVLRSDDLEHWTEMEVDYRAYARRAVLAYAGGNHVWVGTDTGMILKLSELP